MATYCILVLSISASVSSDSCTLTCISADVFCDYANVSINTRFSKISPVFVANYSSTLDSSAFSSIFIFAFDIIKLFLSDS